MTVIDYTLEMDFGRNTDYSHASADITAYMQSAEWNVGFDKIDQNMAHPARMTLILSNATGEWWQDNSDSTFYGLVEPGLLVRLTMTTGGSSQQLFEGKLAGIPMPVFRGPTRVVQAVIEGPFNAWLNMLVEPELELDKTVDQAIESVLGISPWVWPYEQGGWVLGYSRLAVDTKLKDISGVLDLETGNQTIPYVGDATKKRSSGEEFGTSLQGYLNDLSNAEMGGMLFWDARSSKIRFLNRRYYLDNPIVQSTITKVMADTAPAVHGDIVLNDYKVSYEQRQVGTSNSTLWESGGMMLKAGSLRELTAYFKMPEDYPDAQIACTDLTAPVGGVDFIANTVSDGSGDDVTDTVGMIANSRARSAVIKLWTTHSNSVFLTTLQLRGTPLITHKRQSVRAMDADSIGDYDRQSHKHSIVMIDDPETIESYANQEVQRRKTPVTRVPSVKVLANHSSTVAGQVRDLNIGDRVTIDLSNTWVGHSADYIIIGEKHQILENQQHACMWILKPAAAIKGWILGTSRLETDTILVF